MVCVPTWKTLPASNPSFVQHEHDEYERRYGAFIAGQNARNKKSGHTKRNRTIDDLLADVRVCPEETIYQIGKEGDCPPPEILIDIVQSSWTPSKSASASTFMC